MRTATEPGFAYVRVIVRVLPSSNAPSPSRSHRTRFTVAEVGVSWKVVSSPWFGEGGLTVKLYVTACGSTAPDARTITASREPNARRGATNPMVHQYP